MTSQEIIDEIIRYYSDPQATRPVPRDDNGSMILNFGKVIQGQKTSPVTIYVRNEHPNQYPIDLQAESSDVDLKFLSTPTRLNPGEVGEIILQFDCPLNRIRPLKADFGYKITVLAE